MKSKHFDSIIMDDLVGDTKTGNTHVQAIQNWLNQPGKRKIILPRGHAKTTFVSTGWRSIGPTDYELARELIEEVCKD